jgi:hypothetical protein
LLLQVIKAILFWFVERKEEHQVMLMAPTGTAAALIGGLTYHSVLGFTENGDIGGDSLLKSLSKVSDHLCYVDFTLIDKCSMIPCSSLYHISLQMGQALKNLLNPFGGMNVILTGDPGQLPPLGGSYPLYSHAVSGCSNKHQPYKEQIDSMGKAVWHSFTTVVLLTENIRQKSASLEDIVFCTALENMCSINICNLNSLHMQQLYQLSQVSPTTYSLNIWCFILIPFDKGLFNLF